MHVGRLIHQTFDQQRVQAAFDIYNIRPLKVSRDDVTVGFRADTAALLNAGGDI